MQIDANRYMIHPELVTKQNITVFVSVGFPMTWGTPLNMSTNQILSRMPLQLGAMEGPHPMEMQSTWEAGRCARITKVNSRLAANTDCYPFPCAAIMSLKTNVITKLGNLVSRCSSLFQLASICNTFRAAKALHPHESPTANPKNHPLHRCPRVGLSNPHLGGY